MDVLIDYSNLIYEGLQVTLALLIIGLIFGFIFAIGVALARLSKYRVIAYPAFLFTSVIRGTPLLVQIYIYYYGLGTLFSHVPWIRGHFLWPYLRDGFWYVAFALIISTAAYLSEVIRGGLLAVPKGEVEAARAYGMTETKALLRVRLPRALYQLAPTLAGETVLLLKSTALASTIAVVDLLGAANQIRSITFEVYKPLLLVAAIYIIATYLIEFIFAQFEKRIPMKQ
ncbi:ABC transporter permease subunit [Psychromonas sp. 14N.309.X.WAT.B.A12]|uniref:ABC transporter permease n=1 Tax=Psychromonas sp. 14N.309.X.WAT.B.A12 TaxID=2998322 RepID=UPI0025B071C2|nr:ABC transporter permease subunit [Psychromonas sp. 14N.309.X.WAT.B.A12]MDN2662320.1 ABC transporter permease subunit [Psychromonas sp. 14N.309.X.WAT.B.A12]